MAVAAAVMVMLGMVDIGRWGKGGRRNAQEHVA